MNTLFIWLVGLLAALAIGSAGPAIDNLTELKAAQAEAEAVTELEYSAIVDNGGVEFCKQFGRVPHVRPNGDLICRKTVPVFAIWLLSAVALVMFAVLAARHFTFSTSDSERAPWTK